MDKKLLTVAEAAVLMNISRSLLYTMVMRQDIRSITIGKARRIPVEAIDEFIAAQAEQESPEASGWPTGD